jgi:Uma2 family endonuclease
MISSMLELPTVKQRALPITVAQYHMLAHEGLIPENAELLEGVIIEKMPKSPLHSSVLQKMLRRLQAIRGEKYEVRQEQPITCRYSEPEPDLALVDVSPDDYASGHPTTAKLVIEIAVSSAEIDRRKAAIYADADVGEYWIVLAEARQIEVYTQLTDTGYAKLSVFAEGQTARSEVVPAFIVEVAGLFPV